MKMNYLLSALWLAVFWPWLVIDSTDLNFGPSSQDILAESVFDQGLPSSSSERKVKAEAQLLVGTAARFGASFFAAPSLPIELSISKSRTALSPSLLPRPPPVLL